MISYAWVDQDGHVVRAGSGLTLPDGAIELPEGLTAMASVHHMLMDGIFVARPGLAEPMVKQFEETGVTIIFDDLPPGTVVEVADTLIGQLMAQLPEVKGHVEIQLTDPGLYRIEALPPRPYQSLTLDIEVRG